MNLAINARDAMPKGGKLTIRTSKIRPSRRENNSYGFPVCSGDYILLEIIDTGYGMDEKIKKHIFEPFFTTKKIGNGTGLGLAIVYGIVEQHKGCIAVKSDINKGTVFKIFFPIAPDNHAKKMQTKDVNFIPQSSATILFVEDDKMIRNVAKGIFKYSGHKVLFAPSAEDAMDIIQNHTEPIDLLLTDIILPGMNGVELAIQILKHCKKCKHCKPIKILFTTGYDDKKLAGFNKKMDFKAHFIPKPYNPEQLVYKIFEVLNGKKEG
jgi:CheY-like chemotaxis protein